MSEKSSLPTSEIISLDKAITNVKYIVASLGHNLSFYEKERLLSHDFIPENPITLVRKSLFCKTFQVKVNNLNLVIRRKDAKKIYISKVKS